MLPDDSIIKVEVESIEVREVEGKNGKPSWEKLEFKFKIVDVPTELANQGYNDLVGGSIWGSVGARLTDHPDNKLKQWAEALLGLDLGIGFELDTEMLEGRQARAVTSTYQSKNGPRHQVAGLLPAFDRPTFDLGGSSVPAQASAPVVETTFSTDEPPF